MWLPSQVNFYANVEAARTFKLDDDSRELFNFLRDKAGRKIWQSQINFALSMQIRLSAGLGPYC